MKFSELQFVDVCPYDFWTNYAGKGVSVATIHAEMAYLASRNKEYSKPILASKVLLADGVGLIWGMKLLGKKLRKCSGIDLIDTLIKQYPDTPVYIWGGNASVSALARKAYTARGLNIVGNHDGYSGSEDKIINEIKKKEAKVVFVGMGGTSRQLRLVNNISEELGIMAITVGGSLDVAAGVVKRAPQMFQRFGMEWLWRMVQDPKRFKRLPKLAGFILVVVKEKILG